MSKPYLVYFESPVIVHANSFNEAARLASQAPVHVQAVREAETETEQTPQ
jgi:hypothetical protein